VKKGAAMVIRKSVARSWRRIFFPSQKQPLCTVLKERLSSSSEWGQSVVKQANTTIGRGGGFAILV
jgi:hypothetical protein